MRSAVAGNGLRPLLALLAGGATGPISLGHVDLAVIVELIHIATLVHDDIMDEAERRRGPADGERALGKFAQRFVRRLSFRSRVDAVDQISKTRRSVGRSREPRPRFAPAK